MKKLFVSALAMLAVALGFTACSSDDELVNETPAQGKMITVIATTEEPAQRTALQQDGDVYKVVWSADDKIKIIDASSNFTELTLNNEYANQSTGEFTGAALEGGLTHTAYYPSTYDGTTWPAAQTYVANNIPLGVPMKAENIEVDEDLNVSPISFKNEGGILRLNLKGTAKVKSIKISATNLTKPITLNCGEAVQLNSETATPFHIAVPGSNGTEEQPGTAYSGLKIEITDDAGAVCTKTAKSAITVQRSMITDITLTAGSFTPTINGHAYVVLAGYKWATENVGAVTFITPKGTHATYGYLYTQADALSAAMSWGGTWELPTQEQWEALMDEKNCTWTWTNQDGKAGCKVSDNNDASKFIFLPAAGMYDDLCEKYNDQGIFGDYWSADLRAYHYFCYGTRGMNKYSNQNDGMAVRPVSR